MYGLIGYPLGHSFSAEYFNGKFVAQGIDESYHLFPIGSIIELIPLVLENKDLHGINVTIPYKEQVIPWLNSLSEDAKEIQAVNVIKIKREPIQGEVDLMGYNTDWKGFSLSLFPIIPKNASDALVLGTGGASKAVVYALKQLGIVPHLVSRDKKKGEFTYEELSKEVIAKNLIIVNTTPLGMFPNVDSCPTIPYHYLTHNHLCYDLVYNPEVTLFMHRAMASGAQVKNGLEMLYRQAELAWEIWSGR